jgi:hypothetical protein
VLVSKRPSVTNPDETTGYSVALPSHTNAEGEPVYFGGGKLARDLTLPKLRQRWADPDGQTPAGDGRVRISTEARVRALNTAAEAIRGAADAIGRLTGTDPAAASAIAQAASDTLTAVASAIEGRRGGSITSAAELFDQAAREPNGWIARANQRSFDLRAMSRLVHLMGRLSGDKDSFAMLALLLDLARLADTLASLRQAQQRYHQAEAALRAAETLRSAATATGRLAPAPLLAGPDVTGGPATRTQSTEPVAGLSTRDESQRHGR